MAPVHPSHPPRPVIDGSLAAERFALPPLPQVVQRLLELLRSGQACAPEVATVLSADPGLVAEVLKIVNSAYYGLPRQIGEVKHAVAYLGLAEVERLVLMATVLKTLASEDDELFRRFWFHSFHAALISKVVCKSRVSSVDPDELHSAVLLHDMGKLVYLKYFPEDFRRMVGYCETQGVSMIEAEREFNFYSHRQVGALLCDRWRLPASVERACRRHELEDLEQLDERDEFFEETQLVCVSNLLANVANEPLRPEQKSAMTDTVTRALGLDAERFLLLMGEIYAVRSEVETFLLQL
jgi:HD-like signal output (HDOD) protein